MPLEQATRDNVVHAVVSKLTVIGGFNTICDSRSDVEVFGSASILKTLCAANIKGNLIGNLTGNVTGDICSSGYSKFTGILDLSSAEIIANPACANICNACANVICGEINTGENLYSGLFPQTGNVFAGKVATRLQFRSIVAGTNNTSINVSQNAKEIVIALDDDPVLPGNVDANFFVGNVDANLVCSKVVSTDSIIEKTLGAGIDIDGILLKDNEVIAANVFGNLFGDLTGNVNGLIVGNITGNVVGDLSGNTFGVHCGNVLTDFIDEKTGGSGITIDGVLIKDGTVTGNLIGFVNDSVKVNVLRPLGVGTSGEDVSRLETYADTQKSLGLPIFLYDPNGDEFHLEGIVSSGKSYNDLQWFGIFNPTLRFTANTLVTGGITNCSIKVMNNNDLTIQSTTTKMLFDIPRLFNEAALNGSNPAVRSITLEGGDYRIGEISAGSSSTLTFDIFMINEAHARVNRVTNINNFSIGKGCRLEVLRAQKQANDIFFKVGIQSAVATTDAHLTIFEKTSTVNVEVHGDNCSVHGDNLPITFKSTAEKSQAIGKDIDATFEASSDRNCVTGILSSVVDNGTNNEYTLIETVVIEFDGFTNTENVNIDLSRDGRQITIIINDIGTANTSNDTNFVSLSAFPAIYRPVVDIYVPTIITDNGTLELGYAVIKTTGFIEVFRVSGAFTSSGVKSLRNLSASWIIFS